MVGTLRSAFYEITSIPCDDLAFVAMNVCGVERIADASPHQESRPAAADRIVASTPRRGLAWLVVPDPRQPEQIAPHHPGGCQVIGIGAGAEGNGQGWIAMQQHQGLRIVDPAQRDTEEIADAQIDRHTHAQDGTAQHDAFAVKFDLPHAAVRARVMRMEADGQRKRVEPQRAARPGGIASAYCCLTPHGFISPPELCFRSMGETLAGLCPF